MSLRQRADIVVILFAICSFAGWVYETIDNIVVFGGVYLRASFMLPWCPIYGVGGLIILAAMEPLRKRLEKRFPKAAEVLLVSAGIFVLTALVELAGSYVCEWLMGYVPWDYSGVPFNFDGRIAPRYTLRFVAMGLLALYGVRPVVASWAQRNSRSAHVCAVALVALILLDGALEALGVWRSAKDVLVPLGINHW